MSDQTACSKCEGTENTSRLYPGQGTRYYCPWCDNEWWVMLVDDPAIDPGTRARLCRVEELRQAAYALADAAYVQGHQDGREGRSADREIAVGLHEAEDQVASLSVQLAEQVALRG